jgi:hypothetical protein
MTGDRREANGAARRSLARSNNWGRQTQQQKARTLLVGRGDCRKGMASGLGLKESDMTSKTLKSAIWLMLVVSATAMAAKGVPGPGGGGGGGSGGGGGGEETAAQNLSVPAILVGTLGTLVCGTDEAEPSALKPPTGIPRTGYEVDPAAYWWVQKVNTWQAQCFDADTASVFGAWGDNLTGDASLKTGSPIRVELVLTNSGGSTLASMKGYKVLKLEPSKLDRESAYGHDAPLVETAYVDTPDDFAPAEWVVHDSGMMLSVQHLASGTFAVPFQALKPEINATGKVVYGYNLRVTAAGTYRIRFNAPNVTITGVDAGTFDPQNAYLDIVVGGGGGGGGGGKKGGGGGKPTK